MKKLINRIIGVVGALMVLHSQVLNELTPTFNEKECYVGLILLCIAFRKQILEDIKDMFF